MGLLNLLIKDPLAFVIIAVPLLYSIIFHELAHGWVACIMGDPTAKSLGRLSLNPLKHLDPVGTMMVKGGSIASAPNLQPISTCSRPRTSRSIGLPPSRTSREGVRLALTASSAALPSREIATSMRGRAITTELWPLVLGRQLRTPGSRSPTSLPSRSPSCAGCAGSEVPAQRDPRGFSRRAKAARALRSITAGRE